MHVIKCSSAIKDANFCAGHVIFNESELDTSLLRTGIPAATEYSRSHTEDVDEGALATVIGLEVENSVVLDLAHKRVNDEDALVMGPLLAQNQVAWQLAFEHNCVTAAGAYALGRALGKMGGLAFLNLSHNRLSENPALAAQQGGQEETYDPKGVREICTNLKGTALVHLDLG